MRVHRSIYTDIIVRICMAAGITNGSRQLRATRVQQKNINPSLLYTAVYISVFTPDHRVVVCPPESCISTSRPA